MNGTEQKIVFAFVACAASGGRGGVLPCWFDCATGRLEVAGLASGMSHAIYTAVHPTLPVVYAAGDCGASEAKPAGAAFAFSFDLAARELTIINQVDTGGTSPCYIAVDATGRSVLVANYRGTKAEPSGRGAVSAFPIAGDGSLGARSAFIEHHGHGPNRERQTVSHPHSVTIDPGNRHAVVADLGTDRLVVYELDPAGAALREHATVPVAPGAGPRHLAFHPSGRFAFLITELGNTVIAYRYDAARGAFDERATVRSVPRDFSFPSFAADIHVHPNGRFVYGSNRGHDSLAICAFDEAAGTLLLAGHQRTMGMTPRGFAIDPTGRWLLAANQDSDTIVIFSIDPGSGLLEQAGEVRGMPSPVCITFAEAGRWP